MLDRKEWIGQFGPYEAIEQAKDDLDDIGIWLENKNISTKDDLKRAARISNMVHFDNLTIILIIKGSDLNPDRWKLKARMACRGYGRRD